MAFQMSFNAMQSKYEENVAYGNAVRVCLAIFVVTHTTAFLFLLFRTGHLKNEISKKSFKSEKVRQLHLDDDVAENNSLINKGEDTSLLRAT